MSAWRGLANPERHRVTSIPDMAYCVVCGDEVCCWRVEPCRCCLAVEERLTAALAERGLLGNPIVCDRWMPEPETGEIVTLCHHGLDAADCPEHGHTIDDHCPVCFGCCGGFPVPEIECCGRGPACGACDDPEPVPQCGATFNEHRCTLDKDHEGWHQEWVERLVDTATWQDAPEVPEWRALVDAVDLLKGYQYSTPLAAVEDWQDARGDAIDGLSLTEAIFAVQRVRELHHSKLDRHPQGDVQRCIACLDLWPCSTIRAIEGVPNE